MQFANVPPLPSPRPPRSSRRPAGFTLVEVLVAIVILSFGLLGMVGLQAASLQANRDARLQSTAVSLGKELAEMMRGNKDVALLPEDAGNPYAGDFSTSPLDSGAASYCLAKGNSCVSATAVAQAELTEWLARVDAQLPGARVKICNDSAPYDASGLPRWYCTPSGTPDVMVVKIGWSRSTTRKAASTADAAIDRATATVPSIVLPVTAGSPTV